MTKTTVVDYETVEVEKERFQCDYCDDIVDELDIVTVGYLPGDENSKIWLNNEDAESRHLCEDCIELREAHRIREKRNYYRHWWNGTREKIAQVSLVVPAFLLGMAVMGFAYYSHLNTDDPVWALDILIGLLVSFIFAFAGGLVCMLLLVLLD